MELKKWKDTIGTLLNKYKYAVLVLVIGMVLMLIPFQFKEEETVTVQTDQIEENILEEEKLEMILSYIEGAGKVEVMITEKYGVQTIYQTNENSSTSEGSTSVRIDTVLISDSDRNEQGLIKQINPATYQGAIIVCQGADDPIVRWEIYEAVSKITGLGTDKIAVLKMKS